MFFKQNANTTLNNNTWDSADTARLLNKFTKVKAVQKSLFSRTNRTSARQTMNQTPNPTRPKKLLVSVDSNR